MKRGLICVLVLALALLALAGCNSNQPAEGWCFTVSGVTVPIGEKGADALAALKSLQTGMTVNGSCWKDVSGEDVTYQYNGFRILTFRERQDDPNELIRSVVFESDAVKTAEGVTVGNTAEQVRTAYGTPTEESGSALTYDKGNTRLRFDLRDGKVTGISYLALS